MKPEIHVKPGVILLAAHWAPNMQKIIYAAVETAPNFTDRKLWITEGYRKIRPSLDFHELCLAFDFRCNNIDGEIVKLGEEWAFDVQHRLGRDYYAVAHGDGGNFHLHVENDSRPQ